jgi:Protein of unknown function (DUF998)
MTRTGQAAVAGVSVGAGALVMLAALVAAPGSWLAGYVSEAGTAGQPFAVAYRCGLLLLAAGVALLGSIFPDRLRAGGRSGALIAGLLAAAAVLAGTSAVVPCSHQCPLPPFEPTTVADVVHTAASIAGVVVLAGAMLAVARLDPVPAARRMAAVATACTVPLGGALGLTMLLAGRGTLGAVLERLLLLLAVSWLVGTSVVASLGARPRNRAAV